VQPTITVGIRVPHELFESGDRSALCRSVAAVEAAGIDRVCIGDHVAFHGGRGFDGLVQATALAMLCDLEVQTAVYLLPLRHPVPVARQVISLALLAGGRFVFGVGIGGDDPAEVAMCGIDPSTRGRRMDESLGIVRELIAGKVVNRSGGFYELDHVAMLPALPAPVPITVGGRSAAAKRRAGLLSEGYLALWTTPEAYAESVAAVESTAREAGRTGVAWRHGLQIWCGFADSATNARPLVADEMESLYRTPFTKFEKYTPYGTPADVANGLDAYVAAGCREFNLIPAAAHPDEAIASVAEVRRLLRAAD